MADETDEPRDESKQADEATAELPKFTVRDDEVPEPPPARPPMSAEVRAASLDDLPLSVDYVADLLGELGEIAGEAGIASLRREVLDERLPALEQETITVVVLGEFNHGKSTVVNALLGDDVLPVGITPTTSVITHLVYGDEPKVNVQPRLQGERFEIAYEEMERAVKNAEEDGKEPEFVEIAYPNDFLKHSLTLVDTPGVNDISRQKVEITYGYVPRADVILYVLDATQVLKKSEVVFIRDRLLKANRDRIVFVLGKVDALDPHDAEEVELYARERLEKLIGPVELFAFSGRKALAAQKQAAQKAGGELPADFVRFRDYLIGFLNDQRAYIILDSALGGGLRVAALLEQNLAIKKQGYQLEAGELDRRVKAVQAKLKESRQLIAQNLDLIDDRIGGIAATARHNLRAFATQFAESLPIEIERADAKDVKRYLPQFIQDTYKGWLEDEGQKIAGELEALAEEIIEITNESLKEAVEAMRDELGISGELDLEVDTIAYDVSVFALGALGLGMLFANVLVGGLMTLAAPLLAFFLKDKVGAKIKERAREEGVRAVREASEKVEEELLRVIHEYGDRLKNFVETAGDRLYRQIEEVLEQIQKERAENADQDELLRNVAERLVAVKRLARVIKTSREKLAEAVTSA